VEFYAGPMDDPYWRITVTVGGSEGCGTAWLGSDGYYANVVLRRDLTLPADPVWVTWAEFAGTMPLPWVATCWHW
jgi:hypothetical protein